LFEKNKRKRPVRRPRTCWND